MEQVNQPASQPQNQTSNTASDLSSNMGKTSPKKGIFRFLPLFLFFGTIVFIIRSYNNGSISMLFSEKTHGVVELSYKEKTYEENFAQKYRKELVEEISSFEPSENWLISQNAKFEDQVYFDKYFSMSLKSSNLENNSVTLNKKMDLSDYVSIKMVVFIGKKEDKNSIQYIRVGFENKNSVGASYVIPLNKLRVGWNVIEMKKNDFLAKEGNNLDWTSIEKMVIDYAAKESTTTFLDRMWAETSPVYKNDLTSNNNEDISLKKVNNQTKLNQWGINSSYSLLKKITSAKDFTYIAKVEPQKAGPFGIGIRMNSQNFNGYYLVLNGIDNGAWRLFKVGKPTEKGVTTILDEGIINNFSIEKDTPYWLKIVAKGERIEGYFSLDGESFVKLTDVKDSEHASGGVGFYTGGSSMIIDSVSFNQ